jgi:hypothetical protein
MGMVNGDEDEKMGFGYWRMWVLVGALYLAAWIERVLVCTDVAERYLRYSRQVKKVWYISEITYVRQVHKPSRIQLRNYHLDLRQHHRS